MPENPSVTYVDSMPWSEYPLGTKAHAIGGGAWYRTADGWKWNGPDGGGSTFPTPGADAYAVTLPGQQGQQVLRRKNS